MIASGPASYLLLMLAGAASIGAFIAIDRWAWRRQVRRDVDSTWQSFSDGRWRE